MSGEGIVSKHWGACEPAPLAELPPPAQTPLPPVPAFYMEAVQKVRALGYEWNGGAWVPASFVAGAGTR